jgi:hypothetical protein
MVEIAITVEVNQDLDANEVLIFETQTGDGSWFDRGQGNQSNQMPILKWSNSRVNVEAAPATACSEWLLYR